MSKIEKSKFSSGSISMNMLKEYLSKFLFVGASSVSIFIATASTAQAQSYLPYPAGKSYPINQTWNGGFSHQDSFNRYAVDFGMPVNQPVVAVAPGKVIRAWGGGANLPRGCNKAYANNASYVVVDHNDGRSSLYLHLNAVNVSVGQSVSQGQVLGSSGDTGWTCGPHLHFTFQKTNPNGVFGESISGGFVETGNAMPVLNRSYVSQNQGIPSSSMAISAATGRALDSGGSNGTSIYLHPRPDNNPYQRWRFDSLGNGEYRISAVPTGRVLDGGGSNGGTAYLHPQWIPGNNYQKWRLQPGNGGGYMLINVATGRALDAGGSNNTLTYMHPTPNGSNPHHVWRLPG